jgi:hypothetical protein
MFVRAEEQPHLIKATRARITELACAVRLAGAMLEVHSWLPAHEARVVAAGDDHELSPGRSVSCPPTAPRLPVASRPASNVDVSCAELIDDR